MHIRQIRLGRTPGYPTARARLARALLVAAMAGVSLLVTAMPTAAQVGDPAYGAGPGVSAGQPSVAGQTPGRAVGGVTQPGVAAQAPGRAAGGPLVPAQALPNTGSGPATPPTDWGMPAAIAALALVGLAAMGRRNLVRGGSAS
jgi:hypothetical protein